MNTKVLVAIAVSYYILSLILLALTFSANNGGIAVEACYGDPKSPLCEEVNK